MDMNADELIRSTEAQGGCVILLTTGPTEDDGRKGASLYFSSPKERLELMCDLPCTLPEVLKEIIFFSQR